MKNKKVLILIAVMLLGISNFSYSKENTEKIHAQDKIQESDNIKANKATFDKALEGMDNKDFQTSIIYLTAYINSKPKKYEAYKLRGDCYYALREYELAQQDYQTAVDLKSADDKLMTGTKYVSAVILGADKQEQLQNPELGNLYGRLMYAQKALNDYNYEVSYLKAIQYNSHIYLPQPKKEDIARINYPQKYGRVLNPKGIDEAIYGAYDDIENEKYTDVIFKAQKIISSYPDYYLGYYLYGIGLNGLEKDDDAIVAFKKAIEKNPYDFESMASLGNIYFDKAQTTFLQEDARKSTEYFNQALKFNKNCYLYHFYIGMNELQLGNNEVAISEFNKAIKLKSNDYNSIYYKSIAQYLKGDYSDVIDSATKLLYKHVSNYNSVLYLRALAQYKLQNYDKSNADLDTILGNFGDIYNADIRVISPKEQTLESYVYYLKALISQSQGEGAKSDLTSAYKNPIIAQLDKARSALRPYEKNLQSEVISLENYNKYNAFYESSFPKLLQSNVVITETDVDNQYDYIRTTFDDMGLSFVYTNPDYKLSTIKDYPYRKYSSKISKESLVVVDAQASQEVKQDVIEKEKITPELKTQAAPEELLILENENSLAKIMASNSYGMLGPVAEDTPKIIENNVKKQPSITQENIKNVQKIVEEEKQIKETVPQSEEKSSVQEIASEKDEKTSEVAKIKRSPEIVNEKHANINHKELGLKRSEEPEISEHDEVIVLDKKIISQAPKKEEAVKIPDVESNLSEQSDIAKEAETVMPPVTLPEEKKINNIKEKVEDVPAVKVPELSEISKDKNKEQSKVQPVNESAKSESEVQSEQSDIALRPKALIEEELNKTEEVIDQKVKAKELKEQQKIEKAKAKAQAKLRKQQEKAQMQAEKEKAKAQAAVKKEALKAQKAAQKAEQALKKEELKAQKEKEKELSKLEKIQENVEKVLDKKYNIEESEVPVSKKKTVIKELEK